MEKVQETLEALLERFDTLKEDVDHLIKRKLVNLTRTVAHAVDLPQQMEGITTHAVDMPLGIQADYAVDLPLFGFETTVLLPLVG